MPMHPGRIDPLLRLSTLLAETLSFVLCPALILLNLLAPTLKHHVVCKDLYQTFHTYLDLSLRSKLTVRGDSNARILSLLLSFIDDL